MADSTEALREAAAKVVREGNEHRICGHLDRWPAFRDALYALGVSLSRLPEAAPPLTVEALAALLDEWVAEVDGVMPPGWPSYAARYVVPRLGGSRPPSAPTAEENAALDFGLEGLRQAPDDWLLEWRMKDAREFCDIVMRLRAVDAGSPDPETPTVAQLLDVLDDFAHAAHAMLEGDSYVGTTPEMVAANRHRLAILAGKYDRPVTPVTRLAPDGPR